MKIARSIQITLIKFTHTYPNSLTRIGVFLLEKDAYELRKGKMLDDKELEKLVDEKAEEIMEKNNLLPDRTMKRMISQGILVGTKMGFEMAKEVYSDLIK